MPYSNHYSCLIIKNKKNIKNIELDENYYYDSQKYDNCLKKVDNNKMNIKSDCVPYILIYIKIL